MKPALEDGVVPLRNADNEASGTADAVPGSAMVGGAGQTGTDRHGRSSAAIDDAATGDDPDSFPLILDGTGLVVIPADVDRVGVHWHVKRCDLEHIRNVFPRGADPVAVVRLIRLTRSGEGEVIAREPLSDAELSRDGRIWLDVIVDGLPVRAELGLEAPDGGWLLLVRSDTVIPSGRVSPASGDIASRASESADPEPALAATSADLEPVFPEVDVASERQSWGQDGVSVLSSASDVRPSAGVALAAVLPNHGTAESALDIGIASPAEPDGASGPGAALDDSGADQGREMDSASGGQPASALVQDDATPGVERQRSSSDGVIAPRCGSGGDDTEVYAELLVHGRARPGSVINLFGHSLQVGSGGRFSLRLPVANSELLRQALDQGLPLALRDRDGA